MNSNTDRLRFPARAAALATFAVVALGAAACGTETASDGPQPGAPAAPAAKVQVKQHAPTSADAAERRAHAEQLEQFRRHLQGAAQ